MLCQNPAERITAWEALRHPFINMFAKQYLGERVEPLALDDALVSKLRSFGASPRLKQIATLITAHIASTTMVDSGSDELSSVKQLFRRLDTDGDGQITLEELTTALRTEGIA